MKQQASSGPISKKNKCGKMSAQISLEMIAAASIAIAIAVLGYALYAHSYASYGTAIGYVSKYANMSAYYVNSISSMCRCTGR